MPSMHQMQEMTSEEKWNAYEARRAARCQLRRGRVTVTPSTPKPDPAGTIPAPEEPEKGVMPHPEIFYSLSIDLSGVAAVEEEPCRPEGKSHYTTTDNDVPEWVIKRHLEQRSGMIEVEAPTRGDAFMPDKTPELEKTLIDSGEPEWVAQRRLVPTQRPSTIEVEAPTRRDAFVLKKTREPEWTAREWATTAHTPQTSTIEPGNERNSPGSPEWTTVSYRRTTGLRTIDMDPRHGHKMTRSRDEPKRSRSRQPRWRGSPDPKAGSRAPGIDTRRDQETREFGKDPISRSPFKGDAREFAERSRALLQKIRSNPEFAALPRSEQRSLLAELMEGDGQGNDPPVEAITQLEENNDETLVPFKNNWQGNDNLRKDGIADDEWKSRSPCIDHTCEDAPMEQSRELLGVLRRNPEFAALPQSEQRLVFAELLENKEECENLLTQWREGGCDNTEEKRYLHLANRKSPPGRD
ncbi:hypothetical protein H4582DRAFT_2173394 [Lactarius indigo]|nr:hypothetical protein H4582DRAFT_2173394 [Lactarius indigo]